MSKLELIQTAYFIALFYIAVFIYLNIIDKNKL